MLGEEPGVPNAGVLVGVPKGLGVLAPNKEGLLLAPKAGAEEAAPKAGVELAPNKVLPVLAPNAGVLLAPKAGVLLAPNAGVLAPNGPEVAGVPNPNPVLGDAPKAGCRIH